MTKRAGFLDKRLGTIVVYCNRTKTSGLWYVRDAKGENVPVTAPAFQSAEGGMRGLQIYEVTRGGKEGLKLGLILEGEDNEVYKFETSTDTAFARGMLWGISQMSEQDVATGQIGINPTPADPARTNSDNASTILYCNMFVNGAELGYLPSDQDIDWQQVACTALSIANRCQYPIAQVPDTRFFLDQKEARRTPPPARSTQPPARSTGQNDRSGVSYPVQPSNAPIYPPNAPSGLQATANSTVEPAQTYPSVVESAPMSEEDLSFGYSKIMIALNEAYHVNGKELDESRVLVVLERAKVTQFEDLSKYRKHQIVCTFAKELIEAVYPTHSAVKRLAAIVTATPVDTALFNRLTDILLSAFSPDHVVQEDKSEIPF